MKRFTLIVYVLFLSIGVPATFAASRPNILYFYVDDMGWGAIGPNGQAERKTQGLPHVLTPNLDRLAAEGVNFTRSYGCTVCSPARSSQQSGFHQGHTFADRNDPNNAKKAMRADDVLMGDVLSRAGYVTGYWGKWGYGGSKNRSNPVIHNIQTLPTSHGYQYVVAELHHVRAHTFFQPTLWTAPARQGMIGGLELRSNSLASYTGSKDYPDTPALQNHDGYPRTAYCDDVYAFAALDFVRTQAKNYRATGQPFFGLLAVQVPHSPFGEIEQLPEWDRAYRDLPFFASLSDQAKQWAAMITRIDAHLGNLLAVLEDPNGDGDLADSVADNTLVIFQSDNGGPQHPARDEFAANGGLSGSKGSIQEGGIRIPTLLRWPAKITGQSVLKAGTSSARVIDVTDLLPTFCELAGVSAPVGIDGVSIAPTLFGAGVQREREYLIHEAGKGQSIIRGRHKLIRSRSGLTLYDLEMNPEETKDIAAAHPDLVKELESLLLGERVAEPKGFANTYHRWIGKDGASTSDPDNWSDYQYANAGVTYMTDAGTPRISWNALIENGSASTARAMADADLEFLGLEIRGNQQAAAVQSLVLGHGVHLTGRNEIRLSARSTLVVDGGVVSSLRWVDIKADAKLEGAGKIDANLYNDGSVSAVGFFSVEGDYRQGAIADVMVGVTDKGGAGLRIKGNAQLAGTLVIVGHSDFRAERGKTYPLIQAESVSGRYKDVRIQVNFVKGADFDVVYSKNSVVLQVY